MSRTNKLLCIDLRWIDASGVGIYIQGILPGILNRLADVEVVGIGDRARLEAFPWSSAANFQIVHSTAGRYSLKEQVELPRLIPRECDLFFSPYYTFPLMYRGSLAVTVHDMSHLVVEEIVRNPRKRLYARAMYRALARRASIVFTVSGFSKNEFVRLTGFPPGRVVPTHLGISEDWYAAGELPPVRKGPYFVVVGNIKPYKNLPRLLDAFLSLTGRIPHDLVIVGQGEGLITGESNEFFERVRRTNGRVSLAGKVPYRELLSLVGNAQALIMPSLYEGFGLPPVEAMAAGIPVAVSNAGSLPEVCGDSALYFDPLDVSSIRSALLYVASDEALCRTLAMEGREHSRRYQWAITAALTSENLRSAMNKSERSA